MRWSKQSISIQTAIQNICNFRVKFFPSKSSLPYPKPRANIDDREGRRGGARKQGRASREMEEKSEESERERSEGGVEVTPNELWGGYFYHNPEEDAGGLSLCGSVRQLVCCFSVPQQSVRGMGVAAALARRARSSLEADTIWTMRKQAR